MMVEGGALEVSEEDVVEALTVSQKGIRELIARAGRPAQADGRSPKEDGLDEVRDPRLRHGARQSAGRRTHPRRDQPEGKAHAHRGRREGEEGSRRAAARRVPRQQQGSAQPDRRRRVQHAPRPGARLRLPRRWTQAERSPPDHDRLGRAAARSRIVAVHARPDAGARRRHARHVQ